MTTDHYPAEGDEIVTERVDLRLGGSAANTSAALSQVGVHARLVSQIGDDPIGKISLQKLEQAGVDIQHVSVMPQEVSGFLLAVVSGSGQRTMFGYRAAKRAAVGLSDIKRIIDHASGCHVSGYMALDPRAWENALEILAHCVRTGKWTSIDPSVEAAGKHKDRLLEALPLVNHWLLSEREVFLLSGEQAVQPGLEAFCKQGASEIALKLGGSGSVYFGTDGLYHAPACKLESPVDSTGAGDAFNGGYILGLLENLAPIARLAYGNALASLVIGSGEGVMGLLNLPDLLRIIRERAESLITSL
jgi:sugar/nucleoside kinase (ribokinase family)